VNVFRHFVISSFCALLLIGCEGGGNCPWNRPSCCNNKLFGCGPFDIPQGCSCSNYFSRSFQGFPLEHKATPPRSTLNTMEGTWRVALQKSGGGCSYLNKQSTATVLVRERNQQVTVKLLGFVTLRASRSGRNLKPRGQLKLPYLRCTADVTSDINLSSATTAALTGNVVVSCLKKSLSCSASYTGYLKKL
jgi:hypothetical protein